MIQFLIDNNIWLSSLAAIATVISTIIAFIQLIKLRSKSKTQQSIQIIKEKNIIVFFISFSILAFLLFLVFFIFQTIQYNSKTTREKLLSMGLVYYHEGNVGALTKLVNDYPNEPELYKQLVNARKDYRELYFKKIQKLVEQQDFEAVSYLCKLFPNDESFNILLTKIIQMEQQAKGLWYENSYLWIWDKKIKKARTIGYYPELKYILLNPSQTRIALYETYLSKVYVISIDGSNENLIADYIIITDDNRISGWVNDDTLRLTDGQELVLNEYNAPIVKSRWK